MATILKIYKNDDTILRTKCRNVSKIEDWVIEFSDSLWLTMEIAGGIGLAANQVGYDYKMIAIDGPEFSGIMLNPLIIEKSKEIFHLQEGCLSFPGFGVDTGKRSKEITVTYMDLAGQQKELFTKDLTSVIIQHEIDHLNGVIMIDHLEKDLVNEVRPKNEN